MVDYLAFDFSRVPAQERIGGLAESYLLFNLT
jgi:hypothetical protein